MKKRFLAASIALAAVAGTGLAPLAAQAQNIAVVNGKPVPKARADAVDHPGPEAGRRPRPAAAAGHRQAGPRQGRHRRDPGPGSRAPRPRRLERLQAADGDRPPEHPDRPARADVDKKATVSDAEIQAEYDKFKAQASGTEYRVRHILVEKEDEAKAIIAQLKAGAKFEDLAKKNSKDPGSAENGGDLDFANAGAYVPEFSQAMTKLKKGAYTDVPVKTQFGYHIIQLEDTREAKFPPLADVKPQIQQRLAQQKAAAFRDELRAKAKTDYKFTN